MTQIPQQYLPSGPMPFVVDSPLPLTPSGQPPVVQQPAWQPQQQFVMPGAPAPQTPQQPAAPDPVLDSLVQPDQQTQAEVAQLEKLGKVFGVDTKQFKNPQDARQALKILSERFIQQGMNQPQNPLQPQQAPQGPQFMPGLQVQQPQQRKPQQQQRVDDDLDYSGVDPVVANRLRAIEAQLEASKQEAETYRQQAEASQKQHLAVQQAELRSRAHKAIDTLKSPKYGVTGQQTLQQQFARKNVLDMAERMIVGMADSGMPLSTIEDMVLATVYSLDGPPQQQAQQFDPFAGQQQAPINPFQSQQYVVDPYAPAQPAYPVPPAPQQVPQYAPQQPGSYPLQRTSPRDEAEKMKANTHFMAGARALLTQPRAPRY